MTAELLLIWMMVTKIDIMLGLALSTSLPLVILLLAHPNISHYKSRMKQKRRTRIRLLLKLRIATELHSGTFKTQRLKARENYFSVFEPLMQPIHFCLNVCRDESNDLTIGVRAVAFRNRNNNRAIHADVIHKENHKNEIKGEII